MANLSDEELSRIVEAQLPGYKVVPPAPASDDLPPALPPEATTPDLATLRQKYPSAANPSVTPRTDTADATHAAGAKIMVVTPRQTTDAPGQSTEPKAVVVSAATGKIIGAQG